MRTLGLIAMLLASSAGAPRVSGGTSGGSVSTVTAPATGAGVDTCTGNGCAIGPSGISTDGGVTVPGTGVGPGVVTRVIQFCDTAMSSCPGFYQSAIGVMTFIVNGGSVLTYGTGGTAPSSDNSLTLGANAKNWATAYLNNIYQNNRLTLSATAPTVTSACTSPSITHGGASSFKMAVGSSCTGISTVVLGLPTATNGWECHGYNSSAAATRVLDQSADTTTSATMVNYSRTLGTAADFADAATLVISCTGR